MLVLDLFLTADLQNFCRRNAFRISKVTVHDHRTAQRNGKEHAEAAATCRNDERLPEFEALPVANHEHAGNNEDDSRQRACRRCLCLHHVVLQDIRILRHLQHCH